MARVAILLAVYNGEHYLKEQIESLLKQTFQDWICYAHDDGSKDRSSEILEEYCSRYPEKFVVEHYLPSGSASANFVSLLEHSEENYVMFCDQDDVWMPQKIEVTLNQMMKTDQKIPSVVFTDLTVVDQNLNLIADSYFRYEARNPQQTDFEQLLRKNTAAGCTLMLNQKMADIARQNKKLLVLTMHDWGVMLLASLYGSIAYCPESTVLYRQHGDNSVGARNKTGADYFKDQFREIISFHKVKNVRNSVRLEETIIKTIAENIPGQNVHYKSMTDSSCVFSNGKKNARIHAYIKIHKTMGMRKYLRAVFA